jgi:hypothetical protein
MALADGNKTANLPSQHVICGSTTSDIPQIYRVSAKGAEVNHKSPSLKEGRERWSTTTNRTHYTYSAEADGANLRRYLRISVSGKLRARACLVGADLYPGGNWRCHASILQKIYLRQLGDDIGARIVQKIANNCDTWHAAIPTLVTGRPVHVAGDDYAAPAIWFSRYDADRGSGWVLLRRQWDSCIHIAGNLPPVAEVSAKLDEASHYYFERRRSEAERKLSQRQRLARLAWQARKIAGFSLADSYASGNCRPGTSEWVRALGLRVDESQRVSGRELVNRWRDASYPQPDRFGSVVAHLAAQQPQPIAPPSAPLSVEELESALSAALSN